MNAYCPDCETELDQSTGICPACRWDPHIAMALTSVQPVEREMSLTERYRGTEYDRRDQYMMVQEQPAISRGRAFVLVGLAAAAGVSAIAMGALGAL